MAGGLNTRKNSSRMTESGIVLSKNRFGFYQKIFKGLVKLFNGLVKSFLLTGLVVLMACQGGAKENVEGADIRKDQLMRFIEVGWNQKDLSNLEEFFADDCTRRVNAVTYAHGTKELEANMKIYFNGFPDLSILVEEIFESEDHICLNWTINGTNTGEFGELKATGKKIEIHGMSRLSFDEQGKIVYEDVYYNELSLMQQLGHTLNPPILE